MNDLRAIPALARETHVKFQFYLSTLLGLSIEAGFLIWANLEPRPSWMGGNCYGWPFTILKRTLDPGHGETRAFSFLALAGCLAMGLLFFGATILVVCWLERLGKNKWLALGVAAFFACLVMAPVLWGWGSYYRCGAWIPLLLLAVPLFRASLIHAGRRKGFAYRGIGDRILSVCLLAILTFAAWAAFGWARYTWCLSVGRSAAPLIEAIEAYKAETGFYPAGLKDLKGAGELEKGTGLRVREARLQSGDRNISVDDLDGADVTFYFGEGQFLAVVPQEHPLLLSYTAFRALVYSPESGIWEPVELLWSLMKL